MNIVLGYSQVGKASDSDSDIPEVRVLLSQPNKKDILQDVFFVSVNLRRTRTLRRYER